jgi:hypothetical protein
MRPKGAEGAAQRAEGERSSSRRVRIAAILIAFASSAIACSPAAPPSVVLISVDTLRADALGACGGPVATPSFVRVAEEGGLFG